MRSNCSRLPGAYMPRGELGYVGLGIGLRELDSGVHLLVRLALERVELGVRSRRPRSAVARVREIGSWA